MSRLSELDKSSNSLACIRIPLQAGLQFSPIRSRSMGLETAKAARRRPCIYAAPPSGAAPAIPSGGLIAVSPRSEVRQSWLQVQDFGVSRPCLAFTSSQCADWTTFVMRLETSNEGEGKKSLPRADDLVRAARVFDHGPIRVTWRRGQPFRPIPGAAARSLHRRAFELLNLRGARQPKAVACILRKDRSQFF